MSLKNKQCNNILYQLKQIKHLMNRTSLKIIISAYIVSKLEYCNALLTDIQEKILTKLKTKPADLIFKLSN